MTQSQASIQKEMADTERRFDELIEAEETAHGRKMLTNRKAVALQEIGLKLTYAIGSHQATPGYQAAAAMSDEDLHASIEAGMAKVPSAQDNVDRIRAIRDKVYHPGGPLVQDEDIEAAMDAARTPAELASVAKRAGLTTDSMRDKPRDTP